MSNEHEVGVVPVDQMVGGDGDTPGLSQPVTTTDIQDILMSDRPLEDRKMRLMEMRRDMEARASGDMGGEFEPIIAEIDGALATLEGPADTYASRGSLGLDTQNRGDSQPSDRTA